MQDLEPAECQKSKHVSYQMDSVLLSFEATEAALPLVGYRWIMLFGIK